jgi:uncharacterized protein YbjT (DUF2867 family)
LFYLSGARQDNFGLKSNIMNRATTQHEILVLGSTGKTGSRVLERLQQLKYPVRHGSRSASPAFDWQDRSTWKPVLENIHSVYISFQPDIAIPGAVEIIRAFSQKAVESGVKKLVLLSGRGEPEAQECEKIIMKAGVEWTILRASWFCQNFSEGYLLDPIMAGHVALPASNIGEPFIDVDDIAEAATVVLTQPGHAGNIYEVTGPRLLTFEEAIGEIAKATNRPIQYQQVSIDEYKAMLVEYGLPDELVWLITYLFSEVLDGRNAGIADGIQRVLGRKPTDFSDYIKKTIAAGNWNK